jgi:RecB family exonuclease
MIRLVQSSSADARLRAAEEFLEGLAAATEVLVVGASRDAADDLARRVALTRHATFGLHRASLTQLAVRFAASAMARLGVAPATALGAEAVAARVGFEAVRDGALPYFAPVARLPGFARALAATVAELRLAGVEPSALDATGDAVRDMAELLRRFERQLDDGRLVDRAAVMLLAERAADTGALEPLRRMPMILLDVSIGAQSERRFVDALTAVSPAVLVTVPAGDDATLDSVHAIAAGRGDGELSDATLDVPAESDLARARTFLFAPAAPPARDASGDVALFSAPGEGREAVEIARRILEEATAGVAFDRMAVLLRAPEVYGALLRVALERAGVPAYFARGASRPDPSGRAFLALLDCAVDGLSARRFAEYLSLGQVPALDASGAPPRDRAVWAAPEDEVLGAAADVASTTGSGPPRSDVDAAADADAPDADEQPVVEGTLRAPWKWEQLLVESAVIGGEDRWRRRLAGLDAEYRAKLLRLREDEPDSPRAAAIKRDLRNLEHLRRFALPVIERLAAFPAQGTWGDWIAALEGLAPMVLRRPERVLGVLAALRPLDVIGPVPLGEVRDVLAGELTALAERPPAERYGRVFVGTIEQSRGRSFDVVFLPGLAERSFPRRPREDPLLLDSHRRVLPPHRRVLPPHRRVLPPHRRGGAPHRDDSPSQRGVTPLATQAERSQHERLLLRLAVGAARRRLHLSYSRVEQAEARPRVPSFYALEVVRALTGRVPEPQAMERDASAAAGARLAWPAPDDPRRAIDEVEHDLATLRALLASGGRASPGGRPGVTGTATGRARYLFELNGWLMRSLRTRWARWRRSWSAYDGIVRVTDGTRPTLDGARLAARAYSASALQKFAACPYQFFLSAICRLEPRSDVAPIVELDPMTRGHLFHRVQADVMRALAADAGGPVTLDPHALDAARETLDRTLDRVAEQYREELAPAIQRVWQDEIDSMRADLRMWLEQSAAGHVAWEPIAFELAFGLPRDAANDPQSVETEVTVADGFRLRGIVDLVERRRAETDLRVTDYKTGRDYTRRNLVVGGGEMLQPVLYGLAMEQVLGARVVESRLFYCTRAGGFSERVVPLTGEARARGVDVLRVIDGAIAEGLLPPAPRLRACGICDFRDVCGPHEEVRTTLKDTTRIAALRTLRDWS